MALSFLEEGVGVALIPPTVHQAGQRPRRLPLTGLFRGKALVPAAPALGRSLYKALGAGQGTPPSLQNRRKASETAAPRPRPAPQSESNAGAPPPPPEAPAAPNPPAAAPAAGAPKPLSLAPPSPRLPESLLGHTTLPSARLPELAAEPTKPAPRHPAVAGTEAAAVPESAELPRTPERKESLGSGTDFRGSRGALGAGPSPTKPGVDDLLDQDPADAAAPPGPVQARPARWTAPSTTAVPAAPTTPATPPPASAPPRFVPLPPPKPSQAQVLVRTATDAEARQANTFMREQLFPDAPSFRALQESLASATGMPDDAVVEVVRVGEYDRLRLYSDDLVMPGARGVRVSVRHPAITRSRRFLGVDRDGKKFIRNEDLYLSAAQGKGGGLGLRIFARQVANAAAAGFAYLATHAAGVPGSVAKLNGYYTWPRLGYDEPLRTVFFRRPHLARRIRRYFPHAASVRDIFRTAVVHLDPAEERKVREFLRKADRRLGRVRAREVISGPDWWLARGGDLYRARFDLAEGSWSHCMLDEYLNEREQRAGQDDAKALPRKGGAQGAGLPDDDRDERSVEHGGDDTGLSFGEVMDMADALNRALRKREDQR